MELAPSRKPRPRVARGPKRPVYLGEPDLDRIVMMLTALVGEVSALRDRIDTHELLARDGVSGTTDAVEAFDLSPDIAARRSVTRDAMLMRVYRVLFEELERAQSGQTDDKDVS